MAVMRQPIQQRCCSLGITEYMAPFREGQVGSDNDAGAPVDFGQQMKQQGTARLGKRQITILFFNTLGTALGGVADESGLGFIGGVALK